MRLLLTLIFILLPATSLATNAGIVRGIWYDQEVFFVGDPVRIYVAIRNNTGADLSGTVEFFVNDKKIERNNIDALNGRIIESWADWTPGYGTSSITASLSRTEISSSASGTKAIEVVSALAEDKIFVDYDTDGDGQGNLEDKDDDGDGKSDKEEVEVGTDPLVYDEPPEADPAENEVSDSGSSQTTNPEVSTTAVNRGSGDSVSYDNPTGPDQGLEQFLTPSRADTVLSSVTGVISTTKKKLDDYREVRQKKIDPPTVAIIEVNEDGFGEIERISNEEKEVTKSRPKAEKPEGFFGDLITFLGNVYSGVYTVVLAAFSFILGYPAVIQLLLLFLILYLLYRTAKKIGSRPG